jgi:hypothetical protein
MSTRIIPTILILIVLLSSAISARPANSPDYSVADSAGSIIPLSVAFRLASSIDDSYYAINIYLDLAKAYHKFRQDDMLNSVIDSALVRAQLDRSKYINHVNLLRIAETLLEIGKTDSGVSILLKEVRNVDPKYQLLYHCLAEDLAKAGKFVIAESIACLIQDDPYSKEMAYREIAEQYIKRNMLDSALALYKRARVDSNSEELYYFLFNAYNFNSDSNSAIVAIDSIQKYDSTWYYHSNVADMLDAFGRTKDVRKTLELYQSIVDGFSIGKSFDNIIYYTGKIDWLLHYYNIHGQSEKAFKLLDNEYRKALNDLSLTNDPGILVTFAEGYGYLGDTVRALEIVGHTLFVRDSILLYGQGYHGTSEFDNLTEDIDNALIKLGELEQARLLADTSLGDEYTHGDAFRRSLQLAKICSVHVNRGENTKALEIARDSRSPYLQAEAIINVSVPLFKASKGLTREQKEIIREW